LNKKLQTISYFQMIQI